jgi:hypothetical protein
MIIKIRRRYDREFSEKYEGIKTIFPSEGMHIVWVGKADHTDHDIIVTIPENAVIRCDGSDLVIVHKDIARAKREGATCTHGHEPQGLGGFICPFTL